MSRNVGASLLMVLITSACAGPPASSVYPLPSPGSTAVATTPGSSAVSPGPSAPPTSSAPPSAVAFAIGDLAVVAAEGLNIRVAPSRSAGLLKAFGVTSTLAKGTIVLIVGDAAEADGHSWYPVAPTTELVSEPPVGWVASGTDTEPWLVPATVRCPEPSISSLVVLPDVQRIGCYGSTSISFVARQVTIPRDAGLGGTCGEQPKWLHCDNVPDNLVSADGVWGPTTGTSLAIQLFFDPASGIEPIGLARPGPTGSAYRIRGHFWDPAAVECAGPAATGSLAYMGAWVHCAKQFVVESLAVVP